MMRSTLGPVGLILAVSLAAVGAQAPEGRAGQGRGDGARQGGGRAPAPAITTLAGDVLADWERGRDLVVNAANAMPEDKFDFKPTPAQGTFAERLMHIVQVDAMLLGSLGAKTSPPTLNMKATSKADVMAALRQSFDWGTAVVKEFNDQQLVERVMGPAFMGPSASRLRIIYFSIQHSQDVYGQMVVYLRLNGITPPASNRGGV